MDLQQEPDAIGPNSSSVLDVRFLLRESEWRAACRMLRPFVANPNIKPFLRILNGFGALLFLAFPHLFHGSWASLFPGEPIPALFLLAMGLLCLWSATGIGMKSLDHRLNRLDLERHIVVSNNGVFVDFNGRTRKYEWKDFACFRESPELFVLRTTGTKFWTIPIRVISPKSLPDLRQLLNEKLPSSRI